MDSKKIGATLVELRNKKGVSAVEAAKELAITPQALWMYENGERIPRDDIKIRISKYYKKSIISIFFTE